MASRNRRAALLMLLARATNGAAFSIASRAASGIKFRRPRARATWKQHAERARAPLSASGEAARLRRCSFEKSAPRENELNFMKPETPSSSSVPWACRNRLNQASPPRRLIIANKRPAGAISGDRRGIEAGAFLKCVLY